MTRSWRALLNTPIASTNDRDLLQEAVDRLSEPATGKWITGRVASLLAQYYAGNVTDQVMAAIADDWRRELADYPAWAIANAVRWWMGSDNPDRRKKPLPGDIGERSRKELGPLFVARAAIRRFDDGTMPLQIEERRERMSPERAAEIMAAAGFRPKKFTDAENNDL